MAGQPDRREGEGQGVRRWKAVTCAVCGARLTGRSSRLYCSSACNSKSYRARHGDAWRARHREQQRRVAAEWREVASGARGLSLSDLAAIASAPPGARAADLARQLGRSYWSVQVALRKVRQAGGWYCELKLPPCTECGEIVVGPPKQITHPDCIPARKARWVREKRATLDATEGPEAIAERRALARAAASRYYRALPPERRAELLAKWTEKYRRQYEITLEVADNKGARWTDDDDRYILANLQTPASDLALALGRTLWAVIVRCRKLEREHGIDEDQRKRRPGRPRLPARSRG